MKKIPNNKIVLLNKILNEFYENFDHISLDSYHVFDENNVFL